MVGMITCRVSVDACRGNGLITERSPWKGNGPSFSITKKPPRSNGEVFLIKQEQL